MEINAYLRCLSNGKEIRVDFPISEEELRERFELEDNQDCEFIVLHDDYNLISEYTSLEVLNQFAKMIENIDDDIVIAVNEVNGYKADDFVKYDFKFEDCYLLSDVNSERQLGEYWVDELGFANIPKDIVESYFDHEAYGRDINLENAGGFSSKGYIGILN